MMKKLYTMTAFWLLLFLVFPARLFALDGNVNSHDPGALIKDGNRYWMFTTGAGIYAAFSDDLIRWNAAPKTVFPIGTWPEWINEVVPGFKGDFWAPECFFLNGRYYLYYSCSTFGSSTSAIGVASSPTLDQNSPAYKWTDHGMVVSSSARTDINAIDPAIFKDDDGRIYMSYGSFSGGIGVVELDPATGKRKAGAPIVTVAGGNNASWEAPYIFKEGAYYYLIVNRGFCCRGTNSTYSLVMGRSTSINGPYTDKAGVDLKSGGGTTVLGSSGKYIGPGHFGLLRENGYNYVSMHYYDGNDNGNAKLDIANMGFDNAGWPFITRDWVAAGRYKMTNQNSQLVWDSWGCTGRPGEPLAQGPWGNYICQQWDLTPVGNGVYTIRSAQSGMALSLTPGAIAGTCSTEWGTKLQLTTPVNTDCQKFRIERAADGAYVVTSVANNLVVEVPFASKDPGVELIVWGQNGCQCQRWYINSPSEAIVTKASYTAPANTATVSYENLRLQWSGTAQTFNVYLGTSPGNLKLQASNISSRSYAVTGTPAVGKYFWRVDAVSNGQLAVGDVWSFTVEDKVAPRAVAKNISVTLNAAGTVSILPADLDGGSDDAYGIADLTLNITSFNCSNLGPNEVILTVTDNNGNVATANAIVTVIGAIPSPTIRVSRTDHSFTGGDANTIYLGYGAQELTLTATDANPSGLTSYTWSPAEGLSSTTGASVAFAPARAGVYTLTATAKNEFGCTATAAVTITVKDVRCEGKSGKVLVCHRGVVICVEAMSVSEHLNHGCRLDNCTNNATIGSGATATNVQSLLQETTATEEPTLTAYPNPATSHATIAFLLKATGRYSLALYDSSGKLVGNLKEGSLSANEQGLVELNTRTYATGLYLLQLTTEKEIVSRRIVFK
jgi:arabinan endo-1,5-alpha-L-arabinosidase